MAVRKRKSEKKKINRKSVLLIAIAIVLLVQFLLNVFQNHKIVIKDTVEIITLIISVLGIIYESEKNGNIIRKSSETTQKKHDLNASFSSSVFGGLTGGIINGIIIALFTYYNLRNSNLITALEIIPFNAISGCLLGASISIGKMVFHQLNLSEIAMRFFGSLVGCICAGPLIGMLGMWMFGEKKMPFIGYNPLIAGGIIVSLGLVVGTLAYDYNGKKKYLITSLFVALFLSVFVSMIIYLLFYSETINNYIYQHVTSPYLGDLLKAGFVGGIIMGVELGLIVGFTTSFYKLMKYEDRHINKEP